MLTIVITVTSMKIYHVCWTMYMLFVVVLASTYSKKYLLLIVTIHFMTKVPEILPIRAQFTCKVFDQLTLSRSTAPAQLWIVATYLASSSSPVLYAYWQGGIDGSLLPSLCTYVVHYIEDGVARLNVFLLTMQLQC